MTRLVAIPLLLLIGFLPGCGEPQADVSSPKSHRSAGITFDYPGNWEVTDDVPSAGVHYLFVETPGDALIIYQSYPLASAQTLGEFARQFSAQTAGAMPVVGVARQSFSTLPPDKGYEWMEETFDLEMLGESVPHRRLYGTRSIRDQQAFLILQVAEEDRAKVEPGFELIRDTLRDSTVPK